MNNFEYGDHTGVCLSTDPARKKPSTLCFGNYSSMEIWRYQQGGFYQFLSVFLYTQTCSYIRTVFNTYITIYQSLSLASVFQKIHSGHQHKPIASELKEGHMQPVI